MSVVFLTSLSSFAEIALLCGDDLESIYNDNSKAAVHVDFNDSIIRNKNEVKFLTVKGVDRDIKFARMIAGDKIFVRTEKESFLFSKIKSCNGEGVEVTVTVSDGQSFGCACFED